MGMPLSSAGSARCFCYLGRVVLGLLTIIDSRTSSGAGARVSAEYGYRHPEETRAPGRIRGA
jgi:hypothetical protein